MPGDAFIGADAGTQYKVDYWERSISSNTVEQQRIVIAESFMPTFVASNPNAISTATANSHLIQIMGSTINRVYLRRIRVYQLANAGSATMAAFQLLRLSSAGTGGTSLNNGAYDPSDTNSTAAVMTLPSAKGSETTNLGLWTGDILSVAATAGNDYVLDLDWRDTKSKCPVIAAGATTGLCLKLLTAVASATVQVTIEWSEAFWA